MRRGDKVSVSDELASAHCPPQRTAPTPGDRYFFKASATSIEITRGTEDAGYVCGTTP
jgi:hypothetical protein